MAGDNNSRKYLTSDNQTLSLPGAGTSLRSQGIPAVASDSANLYPAKKF
jgi:hypothetical protein